MLLNEITFAGYAGKDAEDFQTPTGTRIVTLSICHTEKARQPGGQDQNTWLRAKVFGNWADTAVKIKKGDNVIIKGKLQEVKWKDKATGQDRTMLEAVAFQIGVLPRESKPQSQSPSQFFSSPPPAPAQSSPMGQGSFEDIPF